MAADVRPEKPGPAEQALPTLRRYHQAFGEPPGDFMRWLRNGLTSWCFDERGVFDADKALAEAFAAVWHWGSRASSPEKVLCVLLMRAAGASGATQAQLLQEEENPNLGLLARFNEVFEPTVLVDDESWNSLDARRRILSRLEIQMVDEESKMFAAGQLVSSLCGGLRVDPEPLLRIDEREADDAYLTRVERHLASRTLLTAETNSDDDLLERQIRFATAYYKLRDNDARAVREAIEPLREMFTGENQALRDAESAPVQDAYAAVIGERADWVGGLVELADRLGIPVTDQQLGMDQLVATARNLLRAAYEQEYGDREDNELLEDAVELWASIEIFVQGLAYFEFLLGVPASTPAFEYQEHVSPEQWAAMTNPFARAKVAAEELIDAKGVPAKVFGLQDPNNAAVEYVRDGWRESVSEWSEAVTKAVRRAARDRFAVINRYLVRHAQEDRSEEMDGDVALIDAAQLLQPIPENTVLVAWLPVDPREVPDEPDAVIHLKSYLLGEIHDTSFGIQSVIRRYGREHRGEDGVLLFVRLPKGTPALGLELDGQPAVVAARDLDVVMTRKVHMDDETLPLCVFGYRPSDTGPASSNSAVSEPDSGAVR